MSQFMHNLYTAEIYSPELFFAADNIGLISFNSTQRALNEYWS